MEDERQEFERLLSGVLSDLEFKLVAEQISACYQHYAILKRWNQRINLTGICSLKETVLRHFGESLLVSKVIGRGTGSVVDVGSGAGFPGVPIAVSWPERKVLLVESVGKKAMFLKEVARLVINVAVHQGRFEELTGTFEWVTLRGVAVDGLESCIQRAGKRVALLVSARQALEAVTRLGLRSVEEHRVPWDARTVVVEGRTSAG